MHRQIAESHPLSKALDAISRLEKQIEPVVAEKHKSTLLPLGGIDEPIEKHVKAIIACYPEDTSSTMDTTALKEKITAFRESIANYKMLLDNIELSASEDVDVAQARQYLQQLKQLFSTGKENSLLDALTALEETPDSLVLEDPFAMVETDELPETKLIDTSCIHDAVSEFIAGLKQLPAELLDASLTVGELEMVGVDSDGQFKFLAGLDAESATATSQETDYDADSGVTVRQVIGFIESALHAIDARIQACAKDGDSESLINKGALGKELENLLGLAAAFSNTPTMLRMKLFSTELPNQTVTNELRSFAVTQKIIVREEADDITQLQSFINLLLNGLKTNLLHAIGEQKSELNRDYIENTSAARRAAVASLITPSKFRGRADTETEKARQAKKFIEENIKPLLQDLNVNEEDGASEFFTNIMQKIHAFEAVAFKNLKGYQSTFLGADEKNTQKLFTDELEREKKQLNKDLEFYNTMKNLAENDQNRIYSLLQFISKRHMASLEHSLSGFKDLTVPFYENLFKLLKPHCDEEIALIPQVPESAPKPTVVASTTAGGPPPPPPSMKMKDGKLVVSSPAQSRAAAPSGESGKSTPKMEKRALHGVGVGDLDKTRLRSSKGDIYRSGQVSDASDEGEKSELERKMEVQRQRSESAVPLTRSQAAPRSDSLGVATAPRGRGVLRGRGRGRNSAPRPEVSAEQNELQEQLARARSMSGLSPAKPAATTDQASSTTDANAGKAKKSKKLPTPPNTKPASPSAARAPRGAGTFSGRGRGAGHASAPTPTVAEGAVAPGTDPLSQAGSRSPSLSPRGREGE